MAGASFNAAEAVEDLTYDFTKYVEGAQGSIPEPSGDEIETYRTTIFGAIQELGLSPSDIQGGVSGIDFDKMFGLVDKAQGLELTMLDASASLTKIPAEVVRQLPFRVQRAFSGWVMGLFFNPED
jgi:hypothetical protein